MSFYDDASLVVIPSAQKTSKLYAVKPTDGSGDLTFTRTGDTATRVNSAGLIEKVRTNSLLNSQNFSAWTLTGAATRTTGVVDPNGGTTAATISNIPAGNLTDGIRLLSNPISASTGNPIRFSIYLKGSGTIRIAIERSLTGDYFYYPVVVTLTSTWTRYEVGGNTGNSTGAGVYVVNATGTTATSVDVAFGQIEIGDVATAYIPTTTAAVSVGPVANVPRLDYLGSTCPRLLLEPQRTNLVTYSEQINNAAWVKGNSPTITTNIATAPDGTISADGIQSADAATYKTITQTVSVSANGTLTLSFFVKKETTETFFGGFTMYFQGGTNKIVYGIVNAVTGTVTYASSTLTATTKVEDYGTYWRIASTTTDNGSNTSCGIGYYGTLSTNGTALNTGAGSVRTIWGFQAEAGAYATSYIPTLAASATRGADACSKTGISSLIGQTQGTIFVEANLTLVADTNLRGIIELNDGGTSSRMSVFRDSSTTGQVAIFNGGVSSVTMGFNTAAKVKIAFKYSSTGLTLYVNGAFVNTDNTVSIPTCSRIDIGVITQVASRTLGDTISQVVLFKTQLRNAELAELTTL